MKTNDVFDKVAANYDLMNDIMSAGTHRYWKECLIDWLAPSKGMKIIDVAGGTGDIARRFLKRINGHGSVTVCDPNENMTNIGKKKNQIKIIILSGLMRLPKIFLLMMIHLMHISCHLVLVTFQI